MEEHFALLSAYLSFRDMVTNGKPVGLFQIFSNSQIVSALSRIALPWLQIHGERWP